MKSIVRPDQMPTVQIENPRRNEDCTPVANVPLQGVAEDDYGITVAQAGRRSAWATRSIGRFPSSTNAKAIDGVAWNRVEGSADRLRMRANYTGISPSSMPPDLKPGDVLEYFLQVTDNFNLNSQTHPPVASGKLRISIVSQEQFTDIITNEMRQAADAVKSVHTNQSRNKDETTDLAKETKDQARVRCRRQSRCRATGQSARHRRVAGQADRGQARFTSSSGWRRTNRPPPTSSSSHRM